jgi:hypothetical protein
MRGAVLQQRCCAPAQSPQWVTCKPQVADRHRAVYTRNRPVDERRVSVGRCSPETDRFGTVAVPGTSGQQWKLHSHSCALHLLSAIDRIPVELRLRYSIAISRGVRFRRLGTIWRLRAPDHSAATPNRLPPSQFTILYSLSIAKNVARSLHRYSILGNSGENYLINRS